MPFQSLTVIKKIDLPNYFRPLFSRREMPHVKLHEKNNDSIGSKRGVSTPTLWEVEPIKPVSSNGSQGTLQLGIFGL